MDTRKLREQFEIVESVRTNSIHPTIDKVRKKRPRGKEHPKYDSLWYMKKEPKCDKPVKEVLGQELFRMLLGSEQPKTRLMLKKDIYGRRNQLFVISKSIPGFTPFSEIESDELLMYVLNGRESGFGQMLVASLFVGEDDLHSGNVGVNANRRVVKIDGGHTFESDKKITAADIAALPKLAESYPTNWIGINRWDEKRKKSKFHADAVLANDEIRDLPAFRREVNQMLLKICLLPAELIRKLLNSYDADTEVVEKTAAFLMKNQREIKEAALTNPDFIRYVASAEAETDLQAFFTYLDDFKTTGKHYLLRDDEMDLGFVDTMTSEFIEMRKAVEKPQEPSYLAYYGRLLGLTTPKETDESIAARLRRRT